MKIESINIVEMLKIGLISAAAIFGYLAYRLLTQEQKKEKPDINILKSINKYMWFAIILAFLVGASEIAKISLSSNKLTTNNNEELQNPISSNKLTTNKNEKLQNQSSFGLKLNSVHWEQIYMPNGDFKGEIKYKVLNTSKVNISDLLPDKGSWFGWSIDSSHSFSVNGNNSNFYDLSTSFITLNETKTKYPGGNEKNITTFYWFPTVNPPLKPKQYLVYSVNINTKGTEKDLFSSQGSFAGLGTPYPTEKLSCKISAPSGYMLIMKSFIVKDRLGLEIEKPAAEPQLSSDASYLTWEIENPIVQALYILKLQAKRL